MMLRKQLESGNMPANILFSNLGFMNYQIKDSIRFCDSKNLPFYYHLGKQLFVSKVLQIGLEDTSAYIGPCFMQSSKSIHHWIGIDNDMNKMINFVRSNIKSKMTDDGDCSILIGDFEYLKSKLKVFEFDLCIIATDKEKTFIEGLEIAWPKLKDEGLLVCDYISENTPDINNCFLKFCRVKNRQPVLFNTRNGVGVIEK